MEDSGGLGEDSGSCLVWEEQQGVPRAEEGEIWVQEQEEGGWKWDRVRQSPMLAEAGVEVGVADRPPSSPAQPRPGPRSPAACTAACTRRRSRRSLRNRSRTAARRARRGRGIVSVST